MFIAKPKTAIMARTRDEARAFAKNFGITSWFYLWDRMSWMGCRNLKIYRVDGWQDNRHGAESAIDLERLSQSIGIKWMINSDGSES